MHLAEAQAQRDAVVGAETEALQRAVVAERRVEVVEDELRELLGAVKAQRRKLLGCLGVDES